MIDTESPKEPELIPMCQFYDPLVWQRCKKGRYGNLKCHSRRKDCPDYVPSTSWHHLK